MVAANNLRTFEAAAFGVRGDGLVDDAGALQGALYAALAQGGGRVTLPVGSTVLVGSTVAVPSGVELVLPVSCTVKLRDGANVSPLAMAGAGSKISGGGAVDGNRANNTAGTWHGIALTGTDLTVEGVTVRSCRTNGVDLTGALRARVAGVYATDNGQHGIALTDSSRCLIGPVVAVDNARIAAAGAGDAVNLAGSSSNNVVSGISGYDSAGAAGRQGYAVREAAGMTGDRNAVGAAMGYAGGPGAVSTVAPNSGTQAADTSALANYLTNGGHEVWQRGVGPFTATAAYAADRWQIALAGASTVSVARDVADVGLGSLYVSAITYTHAAAGAASYTQKIEGFESLRGRVVTLSALVQGFAAGTIKLRANDGTTNYDSAYNVGSGLESLAVTFTLPTGATQLTGGVRLDVATAAGKLDNCSLVAASAPAIFRPLLPAEDLARCQRYYWEIGGLATAEFPGVGFAFTATDAWLLVALPVEMALAPSVTVSAAADWAVMSGAGGVVACTALVAGAITRRAVRMAATVAAGLSVGQGTMLRTNGTLAARVRFEANP